MSKTVHYISLRNIPEYEKEGRRNPPSGQKSDYIIDTLVSLGYRVNYVSISESKYNKLYLAKHKKLSDMVTFFLCPNIPGKYRESFTFRWLCYIYSLFHIHKGDILLVYHTNSMRNDLLRKLADKKHMQFVYEVEEIYAYIKEQVDNKQVNEEIEFLQCPDKYLFVTDTLAQIVNRMHLPYTTIEGYYKYTKRNVAGFNDGKIHCVYGGIIDSVKGGAYSILDVCRFLPNNYSVHILGYGDVSGLLEKIYENKQYFSCQVSYDGLLNGDAYIDFLSKCDIGLCIQSMRQDYNLVSFPSKLVLYLSCGLKAVACRVPVIENSELSSAITFYDDEQPETIAKAIEKAANTDRADIKKLMDKADNSFKDKLKKLLDE